MRSYKLILALKPDLSEANKKKFFDDLKTWLKDLKIIKENEWGQKPLKYSIKKELSGFYMELILEGDSLPLDFEKKLKTSDNILKHMLLKN